MPTADGLYYFLHEAGRASRPPVILIHGLGGDHLSWPADLRRLPDYTVYTLDLPGHGKSSGPDLQSITAYTERMIQFLNDVGLFKAVFVGHSLGGAVTLSLAAEHAERLAGMVLIASGERLPIASSILENAASPSTFPLAVQALHEAAFGPQAKASLKELYFKRLSASRPTLLYHDLMACDAFDISHGLAAIRTPTLVICGTADRISPLRYAENLASSIPGAALQTVDDAGHMVMLEQPRRVAALLNLFLSNISDRPLYDPVHPGRFGP
jgi:pimeloyl-ACP methyl ester carboxylesterase